MKYTKEMIKWSERNVGCAIARVESWKLDVFFSRCFCFNMFACISICKLQCFINSGTNQVNWFQLHWIFHHHILEKRCWTMKTLIHQPNALLQNAMEKLATFFKSIFFFIVFFYFCMVFGVNCKGKTVFSLYFVLSCLVYGKTKYYRDSNIEIIVRHASWRNFFSFCFCFIFILIILCSHISFL